MVVPSEVFCQQRTLLCRSKAEMSALQRNPQAGSRSGRLPSDWYRAGAYASRALKPNPFPTASRALRCTLSSAFDMAPGYMGRFAMA